MTELHAIHAMLPKTTPCIAAMDHDAHNVRQLGMLDNMMTHHDCSVSHLLLSVQLHGH